jgi:hypothetical protein
VGEPSAHAERRADMQAATEAEVKAMGLLDRIRRGRNRDIEQPAIAQTPTNETVKAHVRPGAEDLEVVGESAYQDALWNICGGRQGDQIRCPIVAVLVPEPTNPYDANAISVVIDGSKVGYLI